MQISSNQNGFEVSLGGRMLLVHSAQTPMLSIGVGSESITMHRGNFSVEDDVSERLPLRRFTLEQKEDAALITFLSDCGEIQYALHIRQEGDRVVLEGSTPDSRFNRLWLSLHAQEKEHVYGLGEQFSALDLRGRAYPILTCEQGVGRNKKTMTTFLADSYDGGGGDYWTTYYPQATFVSSRLYYAHVHGSDYMVADFTRPDCHRLHLWNTSFTMTLCAKDTYPALLQDLTSIVGRQPMLPEWAFRGVMLGVQGGSSIANEKLERMLRNNTDVNGVWIQDWAGRRDTSFGQRLQWDWRWNQGRYPSLKEDIARDAARGIHWLGYINPYLVNDGLLYQIAMENGYLIRRKDGSVYLSDFGEFDCGIVDLTNPDAFAWYRDIIRDNLLGTGFRGWMADFGEYLPTDCAPFNGMDPMQAHNLYPTLWAKCNREAVIAAGLDGQVVFYTRSGATETQRYSPMMFGGDQCVDWSLDDGLPSVINAALSLAMTGFGMFTFDIGGYTALFDMRRTKELLLRGCEFAAFTPVMRTHEGNRPTVNHQFDADEETIAFFSRFSRIHTALLDYILPLAELNSQQGIPVMRPTFFHDPGDEEAAVAMHQYMLGQDMLIAPVVEMGAQTRKLYLPKGEWEYLWQEQTYQGGQHHEVPAPLGQPPVFIRRGSKAISLIPTLRSII